MLTDCMIMNGKKLYRIAMLSQVPDLQSLAYRDRGPDKECFGVTIEPETVSQWTHFDVPLGSFSCPKYVSI